MSGEMLERVARAICIANDSEPDAPNGAAGLLWKLYAADALAAIEALREPTKGMLKEGAWVASSPLECWQAMIDEALK
jgi:hypothetical protein